MIYEYIIGVFAIERCGLRKSPITVQRTVKESAVDLALSASDNIELSLNGAVATLLINKPERRNALNQAMWAALHQAVLAIDANERIRAVVLTGEGGKAFCAGADISEFAEFAKESERQTENNKVVQNAQAALQALTKPTIAMIRGACVGGGCGLARACDFRFAEPEAKLGITPAKLGLLYSLADTRRLYNLVGPARSREMLYTGKIVGAAEAENIGLLNRVVATDDLAKETYAFAETLALGSATSIAGMKQVLAVLEGQGAGGETNLETLFAEAFEGRDFREGTAAFMEKRSPNFVHAAPQ
jgi:enoyl-CoA hydratase/carnithine racemase